MTPAAVALIAFIVYLIFEHADCQIPVDIKPTGSAKWISIYDAHSPRVVGYVLVTGPSVEGDPIATSKGNYAIEPSTEHWFAADNPDVLADPRGLRAIKWVVQTTSGENWRNDIQGFIEQSTGLVESTVDAAWDLRAPSGSVSWTSPSPTAMDGLSTFEVMIDRDTWYLSLARSRDTLARVVWGTTKSPGGFTLPEAFGATGSLLLNGTSRVQPRAVFDDHETASP